MESLGGFKGRYGMKAVIPGKAMVSRQGKHSCFPPHTGLGQKIERPPEGIKDSLGGQVGSVSG